MQNTDKISDHIIKFLDYLLTTSKEIEKEIYKLVSEEATNLINVDINKKEYSLNALRSTLYNACDNVGMAKLGKLYTKKDALEGLYNFCLNSAKNPDNDEIIYNIKGVVIILEEGPFNMKEKLNILEFIMLFNLHNYKDSEVEEEDYYLDKLMSIDYEHTTIEEIERLIEKTDISTTNLNMIKDENKKKEIQKALESSKIDFDYIIKCQNQFIEAVIKGADKKENIDNMIDALKKLNVNKESIKQIENYLNRNIEKKEVTFKDFSYNDFTEKYKNKEEEKKKLKEELNDYLDPRTLIPIRFLNFKELKRVTYILKQLDLLNEELLFKITNCNEVELSKLSNEEKIEYYIELVKYYAKSYGFVKELKEINDYYDEAVTAEDEDKEFYLNCAKNLIGNILRYVPNMKEYLKETNV